LTRSTSAGVRATEAAGCAAGRTVAGGQRGRRGCGTGDRSGLHRGVPHLHAKLRAVSLSTERPPPRRPRLAAARIDGGAARLGFGETGAAHAAARFKGRGSPDAWAQGGAGRGRAEPGAAGAGSRGVRPNAVRVPEVGDDRRVPPVGETQEEGGGWAATGH
jgi:hypothetical protein